jgi:nucleoside-diphosphate-sugar epimerase
MAYRIFLAGASGAIGRPLTRLLCEAGHHVTGTARSAAGTEALRALGAEPVAVDVFDAQALAGAVAAARPQIVIHQLTDLSLIGDASRRDEALARNARIRREGTRNLVNAAIAAGARRLVAQSIAWVYAPGTRPYSEEHPLDVKAEGISGVSVGGVVALEAAVLQSPPLAGVVLRYGQLYGPRTGRDLASGLSPVHVDAAAYAALLAVERGAPGIYNIAEPNDEVATDKARLELGWRADYRLPPN